MTWLTPKPTTLKLMTMFEFLYFGNDGEIGVCCDIDLLFTPFLSLSFPFFFTTVSVVLRLYDCSFSFSICVGGVSPLGDAYVEVAK